MSNTYHWMMVSINRFSEIWICTMNMYCGDVGEIFLLNVRYIVQIQLMSISKYGQSIVANVNQSYRLCLLWMKKCSTMFKYKQIYRSIDPEKTITIKAPRLASLSHSEGSVYSTVVNPPRARPGQQISLDVRFFCNLM